MFHYFIIYKPYQTLSRFTSEGGKECLKDYFQVPQTVYPVGRLDYDSEGLLILTDDATLNHRLLNPRFQHEREYWVQVEGLYTEEELTRLRSGLIISLEGKPFRTRPAMAHVLEKGLPVSERNPPIRFRSSIPDQWISLTLTEGKNRQVRRMTAATGHPTLRLIRYRIGQLTIEGMLPGSMQTLDRSTIYRRLGLAH